MQYKKQEIDIGTISGPYSDFTNDDIFTPNIQWVWELESTVLPDISLISNQPFLLLLYLSHT